MTLKDLSEVRKLFLGWKLCYVQEKHVQEINKMKMEKIKHVGKMLL